MKNKKKKPANVKTAQPKPGWWVPYEKELEKLKGVDFTHIQI